MEEQIQLTALLFFIASWLFMSATKEEVKNLPLWLIVVAIFIWGSSGLIAFGLTLYRIWV